MASERLEFEENPVNYIAVFGKARQGKSYLMNQLLGNDAFKVSGEMLRVGSSGVHKLSALVVVPPNSVMNQVSHRNEPCTSGVDTASGLLPLEQFAGRPCDSKEGISVGFMDMEGQSDKGMAYDVQLLCPLLLVSAAVLFNWHGKVAKDDMLERLNVRVPLDIVCIRSVFYVWTSVLSLAKDSCSCVTCRYLPLRPGACRRPQSRWTTARCSAIFSL